MIYLRSILSESIIIGVALWVTGFVTGACIMSEYISYKGMDDE